MNIKRALNVIDQVAIRNRANSYSTKLENEMRLKVSDLRAVVEALGEDVESDQQREARLQREGCVLPPISDNEWQLYPITSPGYTGWFNFIHNPSQYCIGMVPPDKVDLIRKLINPITHNRKGRDLSEWVMNT